MLPHSFDQLIGKLTRGISSQESLTIQLNITNACNLKCAHCYHPHHQNAGAIEWRKWTEILKQYKKLIKKLNLLPDFIICGGESFVHPQFLKLLKFINIDFNRPKIMILTNGTILNDFHLEVFKKMNIGFQISFDGPDSKSHDNVRGAGNFEKSLHNLKILQNNGMKVVTQTILSYNSKKNIESFFKLGQKYKVSSVHFTRFIAKGQGKILHDSNKDRPLLAEELKEAYKNIVKYSMKYKISSNTQKPLFHLTKSYLGGPNRFAAQGIVVDFKGQLLVSSRSNYVLGDILTEGLENLFLKHPLLKDLRRGKIEGCGECPDHNICGGDRNAAFAAFGSFLKKDPGCFRESF